MFSSDSRELYNLARIMMQICSKILSPKVHVQASMGERVQYRSSVFNVEMVYFYESTCLPLIHLLSSYQSTPLSAAYFPVVGTTG